MPLQVKGQLHTWVKQAFPPLEEKLSATKRINLHDSSRLFIGHHKLLRSLEIL